MNAVLVYREPRPAPSITPSAQALALPLALLDEIECGLIVCDAQGRICHANRAAQRELASAQLLASVDDMLCRVGTGQTELDEALRLAAQRGRRNLLRIDRGGDRLLVSVMPFEAAGHGAAQVLVMLGRRHPCSDLGLEMLATSYGLTLSERRVLAGLVRAVAPRQIAADHGVALSTVRTQISSIRAKLGASNIEGLLLRAAEVPPVASALRMGCGAPRPELRAA
ncbi:MAG: helix-turn-helix transcriptional regulator [Burkholderiales bacterium]|nr:helix-turn-helix transcriptional regulator [Burkholderiales bacterium]